MSETTVKELYGRRHRLLTKERLVGLSLGEQSALDTINAEIDAREATMETPQSFDELDTLLVRAKELQALVKRST